MGGNFSIFFYQSMELLIIDVTIACDISIQCVFFLTKTMGIIKIRFGQCVGKYSSWYGITPYLLCRDQPTAAGYCACFFYLYLYNNHHIIDHLMQDNRCMEDEQQQSFSGLSYNIESSVYKTSIMFKYKVSQNKVYFFASRPLLYFLRKALKSFRIFPRHYSILLHDFVFNDDSQNINVQ